MHAAQPIKTILVVDDDQDVREAVAEALEDAGYRIRQAKNGFDALKALDDMMPERVSCCST